MFYFLRKSHKIVVAKRREKQRLQELHGAFRHMAQAKHTGKVVVVQNPASAALRSSASYLITGGFGGLGLLVAKWMASKGAKRLVLVGRSGASTSEARAAVAEVESLGCTVVVEKADVSSASDMKRVVDSANSSSTSASGTPQHR